MTDRIHSITLILKENIRIDDAKSLIDLLHNIKGVVDVKPNVSDFNAVVAASRAQSDLREKLWGVLFPKTP